MPTRLRSAVDCDPSGVASDMRRLASLRALHVNSTYRHSYFLAVTAQKSINSLKPSGLTLNSSTFCPHSVFMCFVWIWEQTAIISLYSINWLVCITETECVYCAVRTDGFDSSYLVWEIPDSIKLEGRWAAWGREQQRLTISRPG